MRSTCFSHYIRTVVREVWIGHTVDNSIIGELSLVEIKLGEGNLVGCLCILVAFVVYLVL